MCGLLPGPLDHESIQIGNIRATSALASAIVTLGLSRAMALYPNPARISLPRSNASGTITSKSVSTKRNPWGITPTISRGRESTIRLLPIAEGSPPNRRCQYP
jgi:hypothetical protein